MPVAGIIAEYDPLHQGHLYQISRVRELLGADTAVVCVMSGNFVQRGGFAVVRKHVRAEAAVRSGADLVLELPLPWAAASAERFGAGGVEVLERTGAVTHLAFGSECGDVQALLNTANALCDPAFPNLLRAELSAGVSFAAAREQAVARLSGAENARLLETPNNILGVEYCKALLRRNSGMVPLTVLRKGPAHNGGTGGALASASAIRALLTAGKRDEALALMAPAMRDGYRKEETAGRAPAAAENCQRAILARLRTMTAEEFQRLDGGNEGLGNRFYAASREAATLSELLNAVKTKRYAYSRIRRMALWAYLGLFPGSVPAEVPYLRVLAANQTGRALLGKMRKSASVPVLTRPAGVRRLNADAQALFALESRAADLYALAYPRLTAAGGGVEWRIGPVMV